MNSLLLRTLRYLVNRHTFATLALFVAYTLLLQYCGNLGIAEVTERASDFFNDLEDGEPCTSPSCVSSSTSASLLHERGPAYTVVLHRFTASELQRDPSEVHAFQSSTALRSVAGKDDAVEADNAIDQRRDPQTRHHFARWLRARVGLLDALLTDDGAAHDNEPTTLQSVFQQQRAALVSEALRRRLIQRVGNADVAVVDYPTSLHARVEAEATRMALQTARLRRATALALDENEKAEEEEEENGEEMERYPTVEGYYTPMEVYLTLQSMKRAPVIVPFHPPRDATDTEADPRVAREAAWRESEERHWSTAAVAQHAKDELFGEEREVDEMKRVNAAKPKGETHTETSPTSQAETAVPHTRATFNAEETSTVSTQRDFRAPHRDDTRSTVELTSPSSSSSQHFFPARVARVFTDDTKPSATRASRRLARMALNNYNPERLQRDGAALYAAPTRSHGLWSISPVLHADTPSFLTSTPSTTTTAPRASFTTNAPQSLFVLQLLRIGALSATVNQFVVQRPPRWKPRGVGALVFCAFDPHDVVVGGRYEVVDEVVEATEATMNTTAQTRRVARLRQPSSEAVDSFSSPHTLWDELRAQSAKPTPTSSSPSFFSSPLSSSVVPLLALHLASVYDMDWIHFVSQCGPDTDHDDLYDERGSSLRGRTRQTELNGDGLGGNLRIAWSGKVLGGLKQRTLQWFCVASRVTLWEMLPSSGRMTVTTDAT